MSNSKIFNQQPNTQKIKNVLTTMGIISTAISTIAYAVSELLEDSNKSIKSYSNSKTANKEGFS